MRKKILIIVAHSDDEILGCGGTIARLVKEGNSAATLILGEGITSRDKERNASLRRKDISALREQARKANKLIGAKEVFFHDLPDNRFDTVPLLEIIKVIERFKEAVRPDVIFTHFGNDLNIDHQIIHKAVLTAARPIKDESVKEIYAFEVLSSTEWNYPFSFSPDVFFDITGFLKFKLNAMERYKLEIRQFPHPRSIEGLKINARYWGMHVGLSYAEAFKCIRLIK